MFRRLISMILRADFKPSVAWSEVESMEIIARQSVEVPLPFSRTETWEQVLCVAGNQLTLFAKWHRSGDVRRIRFSRPFDAERMKLSERISGPDVVYRLQLNPMADTPVRYDMATPTWFGLWRNEPTEEDLGASMCFFDSTDRSYLTSLRSQLLNGEVPESLLTEEAMRQKINSLSEENKRAAFATLVMRQHGEAEQKFREESPNLGPIPGELRPIQDHLQQRLEQIRQTAAARPVDPELAGMIEKFTTDAYRQIDAKKPSE